MGSRLFGYNSGAPVSGASQSGSLAISNDSRGGGSVQWYNGPDEDLGYVIGYPDTTGLRKVIGVTVSNAVGFMRTSVKTDVEFLSLANSLTGQGFMTASTAVNWLNTNGYYTSYSASVDTDAQAFITAAGITDSTQQTAINTLVVGLKADSLWTSMYAIYPFVGGTTASHKFNLKDPRDLNVAYRLTFNGGWTHNSNGITGNGTNAFAESYYFPITINTIGAYNRTLTSNQTLLGSTFTGVDSDGYQTNPIGLVLRSNSVSPGYIGTVFSAGIPVPAAITVSRTAGDGATAIKVYRNGTQNSTGNNSEWQVFVLNGASVPSMIIGARRQDDYDDMGIVIASSYNDYTTANIAFAFMGDTALTATEVTNLNTRIQAFQTTLGRNV